MGLTRLVSLWVKRLSIVARKRASELVLFDTFADGAVALREFVALALVRDANPRIHIFAQCVPAEETSAAEPPWLLRITTRIWQAM